MKQFTTQFSQTLTVHFATQWIRLRLPTCRPRFESQAHHICFYHLVIVKVVLYLSCEKNENKQKRPGGCHSSVVSSAPTILRARVQIPSTPSMVFLNLYYWNCIEKITKINKKRLGLAHFFLKKRPGLAYLKRKILT